MHFGTTKDGRDVEAIALHNGDLSVTILTLGAIVQDLRLAGVDRSLTLGSETLADYEGDMRYHGALIGPVANRISTARVRLGGMMHELERNQDGRIHLHSGAQGTHLQIWEVVAVSRTTATLAITLPDGMCGLPGNRRIVATYSVQAPATLTLDLQATTDDLTLMNLANHSYWNLDGTDTYAGHQLRVAADHYLPVTDDFCPTGEIMDVTGTNMDLRAPRTLEAGKPAMDNNFCLSDGGVPLRDVLWLTGTSGVTMVMATTAPGLQIYDGRDGRRPGHQNFEGLAIEAQGWPDAPNNPAFPSVRIDADTTYRQTTRWQFQA